jgi:ParB family chromosome partitioning protein
MATKASFRPRQITDAAVALAERASQDVPLAGDPRLESLGKVTPIEVHKVGAIQLPEVAPMTYVVGQIYDIPVQDIKSNPYNARVIYTSVSVDEMAVSLSEKGQTTPATAYISKLGEVTLIDGETRLRGSRSGGLSKLRIEIQEEPINNRALYEKARTSNVHRNDQTPLDDALKWRAFIDEGLYKSQNEIADSLGHKKDHVSRIIQLASLPMAVMYALAEEPTLLNLRMLTAIREFQEKKGEEATLDLIPEIVKNDSGYRKVTELAKASDTVISRARADRSVVSYGNARGEVKTFAKGGRLELSIKGLAEDDIADLKERIVQLLQKK